MHACYVYELQTVGISFQYVPYKEFIRYIYLLFAVCRVPAVRLCWFRFCFLYGRQGKLTAAIDMGGDVEKALSVAYKCNELGKCAVILKQQGIADKDEMFAGSRHCHVEFAVDNGAVFLKHIVAQEV